jgi:two-component system sensor histidine kinase ChvG
MYDAEGQLWADSFALDGPAFSFDVIGDETTSEEIARALDRGVDWIVGADPIPDYIEPEDTVADAWPELARAREQRLTQIQLRDAPDGTPVINAAAPVGLLGATLLTTRNAVDITNNVRSARTTIGSFIGLALLASVMLSLFLARTIVRPLQLLSRAAIRVRLGRDRQVEVPRLPERRDEIGLLARTVSDMTQALRQRIDEVESFAADVAHELKNPLASLRSALETLDRVDDPELQKQLLDIATHDVRRIDRLVTEISEASRIDAEMSRAEFEYVNLAELVSNVVAARTIRPDAVNCTITLDAPQGPARVSGVPFRLERVFENLIDNAVSFSPDDGVIEVSVWQQGDQVMARICDQGPGIAEEEREKIFHRFHSARPEAEDFGDHSGLGLAIARTIVLAHEGSLMVQDRPDGQTGSCFTVCLPALP